MANIFIYQNCLKKMLELGHATDLKRLNRIDRQGIRAIRLRILRQYFPDLEITTNSYGKPVALNIDGLHFNHSHSQNHYILVFSTDVINIGVDMEDLSRNVRMHRLAREIFHPDEYEIWQELDFCREYWFKVWTIKEAIVKAHGIGLTIELASLNTHAHPSWNMGTVCDHRLGEFSYQNFTTPDSMITIAHRQVVQNTIANLIRI